MPPRWHRCGWAVPIPHGVGLEPRAGARTATVEPRPPRGPDHPDWGRLPGSSGCLIWPDAIEAGGSRWQYGARPGASPVEASTSSFFRSRLKVPADTEHLLHRPHFIAELLDEAAKAPITSVVAPAGSGKTSLLVDWCSHVHRADGVAVAGRDRPGRWAVLDRGGGRACRAGRGSRWPCIPEQRIRLAPWGVATLVADARGGGAPGIGASRGGRRPPDRPRRGHRRVVGALLEVVAGMVARRAALASYTQAAVDGYRARGQLGEVAFAELRFSDEEAEELLVRLVPTIAQDELTAVARLWPAAGPQDSSSPRSPRARSRHDPAPPPRAVHATSCSPTTSRTKCSRPRAPTSSTRSWTPRWSHASTPHSQPLSPVAPTPASSSSRPRHVVSSSPGSVRRGGWGFTPVVREELLAEVAPTVTRAGGHPARPRRALVRGRRRGDARTGALAACRATSGGSTPALAARRQFCTTPAARRRSRAPSPAFRRTSRPAEHPGQDRVRLVPPARGQASVPGARVPGQCEPGAIR